MNKKHIPWKNNDWHIENLLRVTFSMIFQQPTVLKETIWNGENLIFLPFGPYNGEPMEPRKIEKKRSISEIKV